MALENYANAAATTLSGSINNSVTSLTVASATGFPAIPRFRILIGTEILLVTGVAGTTWTVTRGEESTTAASHTSGDAVTQILTEQGLRNLVGDKTPIEKGDNLFLMCGFVDYNESNVAASEQQLRLFVSGNGFDWNSLSPKPLYRNPTYAVGGFLRDPSITYYEGAWYVCHTCDFLNSVVIPQFKLIRSYDLITWETLATVSVASISSNFDVWAPEWFIDSDGSLHIFVAVSTGGVTTNFQIYEMHPTNLTTWRATPKTISTATSSSTTATITTSAAHGFSTSDSVVVTGVNVAGYNGTFTITVTGSTTFTYTTVGSGLASGNVGTCNVNGWSNPVIVTGTSLPSNMIDGHMVKIGATYYLFAKDQTNSKILVMSSSALTSGYTVLNASVSANGSNTEGPSLVQIDSTTWRMYIVRGNEQGLHYMESSDTFVTWTALTAITNTPYVWNHGTVLRIQDLRGLRSIVGLFMSHARPLGALLSRASNQSMSNGTTTDIQFTSIIKDDLGGADLGADNKIITATAPGWYTIHANLAWVNNGNTGGETVLDVMITKNGTGSTIFIGGARDDNASIVSPRSLSTSPMYYLDRGDNVRIRVFQNSGGTMDATLAYLGLLLHGGY